MKYKVFAIYDGAVEAYLNPFHLRSVAEAIRSVQDLVNDPKMRFHQHAADYTLYEVAEYDDCKGQFYPHQSFKNLGVLKEFQRSAPELSIAKENG